MNQKREIEESYFNSKQLILFPKLKCLSPFVYTVEIIWFNTCKFFSKQGLDRAMAIPQFILISFSIFPLKLK